MCAHLYARSMLPLGTTHRALSMNRKRSNSFHHESAGRTTSSSSTAEHVRLKTLLLLDLQKPTEQAAKVYCNSSCPPAD